MGELANPPLIEAIFELRWGEVLPGQFKFSRDEQTLFAGKISAALDSKGYGISEIVHPETSRPLPMFISHRFRAKENTWPVYQVGLGIFTVNQLNDGYSWESFKNTIETGLEIYSQADPRKLALDRDTLSFVLRYQDAFFPPAEQLISGYLEEHFNVRAGLPENFLNNENIDSTKSTVNINIHTNTVNPKGEIVIAIANAIINQNPGLLMETVVTSKAMEAIEGEIKIGNILEWTQSAHALQQHAFRTVINPSAYN